MKLLSLYPAKEKELLSKTGADFIKTIGNEAIREAVLSILEGENVRNSTEFITRRRLAISNGSLLIMFLEGCRNIEYFSDEVLSRVVKELKNKGHSKSDKWILEWMLGLTDKAVQNILRDKSDETEAYKEKLEKVLEDSAAYMTDSYGELDVVFKRNKKEINVDWGFILKILLSIGAQTLTIRGSEKSTYGKLFEKLILGSLLEVLGFEFVDESDLSLKTNKFFWLSKTEKRESDATLIYEPGKGVRFDIGFIGRGNTEISLDKVSRFEKETTIGKVKHYLGTYIIVDRIGASSKIEKLAREINGDIIQMSLSYWVRDIAELLKRDLNFTHPITGMSDKETSDYISKALASVDLMKFLP